MKLLILLCLVAVPATFAVSLSNYQAITSLGTWREQLCACRAIGAGWDLAKVDSVALFNDLKANVITQLGLYNQIWIGGSDGFEEGKWYWSSNWCASSPITTSNLKLRDSDGLGNDANEDGGPENCMEMSKQWDGLNDRPCGSTYFALCQKF